VIYFGKSITLASVIWDNSKEHMNRTVRVMRWMESRCWFDRTVLFSACAPPLSWSPCRLVQIPATDEIGFNTFLLKTLPHMIDTELLMLVQDDGFIIDPDLWNPAFATYDFIGAPWGDGFVGNWGFCIQSHKFLNLRKRFGFIQTANADTFLCRDNHLALVMGSGIRFAPTDLAAKFSTETTHNDQLSLGFHGRTHSPEKYKLGWERIEAWEKTVDNS